MARIVLQTPQGEQVVDLRATNSIGRHPSNSIQLLDKIVSKEHCIIERRGSQYVLRDLSSLNGTFVNGERVAGEAPLRHGCEIALGSTRARFEETTETFGGMAGVVAPPPPPAWPVPQQPPQQPPPSVGYAQAWPQVPVSAAVPSTAQSPAPAAPPLRTPLAPAVAPPPRPTAPAPGGYPQGPRAAEPPAPHSLTSRQVQQRPPSVPPPPPVRPPPAARVTGRGFATQYLPQVTQGTHVDQDDQARQIGAEIRAVEKEFVPFQEICNDQTQLRADYERLRLSYELSRDIANERDTGKLLQKILQSIFRFIPAQRGVMFLKDENGEMAPRASFRRDGSTSAISISTTILEKAVKERTAVLTHDAAMDFAASKGKSMILNRINSAVVAPMLHDDEVLGALWLDSQTLAQFQPKDLQLISGVAAQAAMFIEINILGKQIEEELLHRERLCRLLSPNVAERVISGELDVRPGGTRTECTIFNSDIRGFTRMSESAPPEEIVEMLNQYFEQMVDTVFKYEGTLDKFMGDGIMALWGAPVVHPDDAARAVECALEQTEVLGRFNRGRLAQDKAPLGVGYGIHTGQVVAGNIGSSKALSYTVIGDVANTSSRLCALARAGQIIVSETTHERLAGRFQSEELAPAQVKGKGRKLRIFNITGSSRAVQIPVDLDCSTADEAVAPPTTS
ncbi:MAG: FHA domain-containing protein [Deltaproteobacteria bacterium]|nr:FHA domain-containing protein [Deltaproteobacteria bacterium]